LSAPLRDPRPLGFAGAGWLAWLAWLPMVGRSTPRYSPSGRGCAPAPPQTFAAGRSARRPQRRQAGDFAIGYSFSLVCLADSPHLLHSEWRGGAVLGASQDALSLFAFFSMRQWIENLVSRLVCLVPPTPSALPCAKSLARDGL